MSLALTFSLRAAARTLAATLALAAAGCVQPASIIPADGVYVGRVGDIMIAVVGDDDLVTAYACDGDGDQVSLSPWFHGQLDGGVGTLPGDGGAELVLDMTSDGFLADLHVGGEVLHATGERVEGDDVGLFWGEQDDWIGGWIFDASGDQRGAVIKRNTGDVAAFSLPAAEPQTITLEDGTAMAVTLMAAPKPMHVHD